MEQSKAQPRLDETLAAILAHPIRCEILTVLHTRVASPNELARMLGHPLGTVSYHVRRLHDDLQAIELVDEKPRRGATEHYYRGTRRPTWSAEEFVKLSETERQDVIRYVLQLLSADHGSALAAGTLGKRIDTHATRTPGTVDEQGWAEIAGIFDETFQRVLEAVARSAGRGSGSIPLVAGLTLVEMPYAVPQPVGVA